MTFPIVNALMLESKLAYFDFWNVTSGGGFTYEMTIKGTVGKRIKIDWGDTNENEYVLTGNNQPISHVYAAGTFQQKWGVEKLSITTIIAANENLTGALPVELQGFYSLTYLKIDNNSFTGDLGGWSTELAKWVNITDFYIHSNSFTGDLSSWSALSAWTSITDFSIHINSFTGDLSSWSALSAWTNVTTFSIYTNSFTGDLSSWSVLLAWTSIIVFYIHNNSFTGDLSGWSVLSAWTSVTNFLIYTNSFTGDLSSWSALSAWTSVIQFLIHDNSFTGDLSVWSSLSTWTSITDFSIHTNSFTGDLSGWSTLNAWLDYLTFYIQSNSFTGLNSWIGSVFTSRASFNSQIKNVNESSNSESLTGVYQQPDLGTYSGNIDNLTETEINNLVAGTDYDGGGTNVVWTVLEKVWILDTLAVSSIDPTLRYNFIFIYS